MLLTSRHHSPWRTSEGTFAPKRMRAKPSVPRTPGHMSNHDRTQRRMKHQVTLARKGSPPATPSSGTPGAEAASSARSERAVSSSSAGGGPANPDSAIRRCASTFCLMRLSPGGTFASARLKSASAAAVSPALSLATPRQRCGNAAGNMGKSEADPASTRSTASGRPAYARMRIHATRRRNRAVWPPPETASAWRNISIDLFRSPISAQATATAYSTSGSSRSTVDDGCAS